MKLIFVYNADSGRGHAILDSLHKLFRPDSYACKLCALTFNTFSEKGVWRRFRKTEAYDMSFLHKDEFQSQYRSKWLPKFEFPVILIEERQELVPLITAAELNALSTTEGLISLIRQRSNLN